MDYIFLFFGAVMIPWEKWFTGKVNDQEVGRHLSQHPWLDLPLGLQLFQPITWCHVAYPSRARLIKCSLLDEISISTNRRTLWAVPWTRGEGCGSSQIDVVNVNIPLILRPVVEDQVPHKSQTPKPLVLVAPGNCRERLALMLRETRTSSGNVKNEQPTNHPGPHPPRTLKDKWRRLITRSPYEDDHRGSSRTDTSELSDRIAYKTSLVERTVLDIHLFYSTTKYILKQPPVHDSVEDLGNSSSLRIGARSI